MTRLVLMAKAPAPGRVKTRLARDVGDDVAAALATAFIEDLWAMSSTTPGVDATMALEGDRALLPAAVAAAEIVAQGEGDLGQRMARHLHLAIAADKASGGQGRAVMIGTDMPGLPRSLVVRASKMLGEHDAVLGPAEDGGFYLIAMRRCELDLLDGLPWGGPEALERTEQRLRERGLSVGKLPVWFDVDHIEDVVRLRTLLRRRALSAPRTAAVSEELELPPFVPAAAEPPAQRPGLSVIIPTLNEAARLPDRLRELLSQPAVAEVIVADGGSTDGTVELAGAFPGVRLLRSAPGRARQLNHGAVAARADAMLFLHADARLPADALVDATKALESPDCVGGAFHVRHFSDGGRWRLGPILRFADRRSKRHPHPYGDQAIFVRRSIFEELGGFPDIALMEDLALSQRLAARGRLARCPRAVAVSGRRFETRPVYYMLVMHTFPLLWRLGVSPNTLLRLYRHTR